MCGRGCATEPTCCSVGRWHTGGGRPRAGGRFLRAPVLLLSSRYAYTLRRAGGSGGVLSGVIHTLSTELSPTGMACTRAREHFPCHIGPRASGVGISCHFAASRRQSGGGGEYDGIPPGGGFQPCSPARLRRAPDSRGGGGENGLEEAFSLLASQGTVAPSVPPSPPPPPRARSRSTGPSRAFPGGVPPLRGPGRRRPPRSTRDRALAARRAAIRRDCRIRGSPSWRPRLARAG